MALPVASFSFLRSGDMLLEGMDTLCHNVLANMRAREPLLDVVVKSGRLYVQQTRQAHLSANACFQALLSLAKIATETLGTAAQIGPLLQSLVESHIEMTNHQNSLLEAIVALSDVARKQKEEIPLIASESQKTFDRDTKSCRSELRQYVKVTKRLESKAEKGAEKEKSKVDENNAAVAQKATELDMAQRSWLKYTLFAERGRYTDLLASVADASRIACTSLPLLTELSKTVEKVDHSMSVVHELPITHIDIDPNGKRQRKSSVGNRLLTPLPEKTTEVVNLTRVMSLHSPPKTRMTDLGTTTSAVDLSRSKSLSNEIRSASARGLSLSSSNMDSKTEPTVNVKALFGPKAFSAEAFASMKRQAKENSEADALQSSSASFHREGSSTSSSTATPARKRSSDDEFLKSGLPLEEYRSRMSVFESSKREPKKSNV